MASGRKLLMTGASGFIGRRVLPLALARGYEVHAISRRPPVEAGGAHWHELDLADHAAVDRLLSTLRPSHLLHLAWQSTFGDYYHTPRNFMFLRDSLSLVDSFVRAGGRRMVAAGTSAEYDLTLGKDFTEDRTELRPNGLYGACKKALYEVSMQYARQTGVEHAWGRVFFCYGPGEHPSRLVPTLLHELEAGHRVSFQAGTTIRDYLHVDDVAEAFGALLDSTSVGAFNVGSGEPIALADFVRRLAALSGHPEAVDLGALPTPTYEPPRVVADVTRTRRELGWRPRYSLESGLADTILWWRKRWAQATRPNS